MKYAFGGIYLKQHTKETKVAINLNQEVDVGGGGGRGGGRVQHTPNRSQNLDLLQAHTPSLFFFFFFFFFGTFY